MHKKPHLLLVVGDPLARAVYLEQLAAAGATCTVIETPEELGGMPDENEFCGMMLDLYDFVRLSSQHKATLKEYAIVLPTIKLYLESATNAVRINYSSFEDVCTRSVADFVQMCATFPGRAIRREQRYSIFLNAMLGEHLTIVTNLSRRGCFIFTTDESLRVGDTVSFSTVELGDQTPIRCVIRRKVEWGSEYLSAGVGVEFLSMTEPQRTRLDAIITEYVKNRIKLLEGTL